MQTEVASDPLGGYFVAADPDSGGSSGCWVRQTDATKARVAWWGVAGDWTAAQILAGTADDTAEAQAAIGFVEANLNLFKALNFHAGNFVVSTLRAAYCSLRGAGAQRNQGTITLATKLGSRLIHKVGATDHLLYLNQGNGWEEVSGFSFQGFKNLNKRASVAITGASDRQHFSVATASVPAAPTNVANWPYYGLCLFLDSAGYICGTGIVQAANSGTGEITLAAGEDNYATKTGASNLLTTTERVIFAPRNSWSNGSGESYTNVSDSTFTGYDAIVNLARSKNLRDLYIRDFHCAIVDGDSVGQRRNIWVNNCTMAAIAARHMARGSDFNDSGMFLQGYGEDGLGVTPTTASLDNTQYKTSYCGLWGMLSKSTATDYTCDQFIHGIVDNGGTGLHIGYLHIDKPLKEAIVSKSGVYLSGLGDNTLHIDTMVATSVGQAQTMPSVITYSSGHHAVIALEGSTGRQVHVGSLSCAPFDDVAPVNGYFDCITNIVLAGTSNLNEVTIGTISALQGVAGTFQGVKCFKIGTPFGYGGTTEAHALAVKRMLAGADDSGLVGVTDAADKRLRLTMFNQTLADPPVCLLDGFADATLNALTVGGGDGARQAVTRLWFNTASAKATGAGTTRLAITSDGKIGVATTSPNYVVDIRGALGIRPGSSVTPSANGDLVFEATSDTSVTIKLKGSDGTVRSAVLTVA